MKRLQAVLLVFAFFCSLVAAHSAPLDTLDTRLQVLEAARIYLPHIAQNTSENWVIIRVQPDNVPDGLITSGHYTVLQQFGPVMQSTQGTYYWWTQSSFGNIGSNRDYALIANRQSELSLFAFPLGSQLPQDKSRYLLCALNEKASAQDKFFDIHLLPPGWEKSVLPAIVFLRSHPQSISPAVSASEQTDTRFLLHSDNPYLQLTALQVLLARRSLTAADLDIALSSPDQRIVAAAIALVRFYGWATTNDNAKGLTQRIAKVTSLDQLQAIALGISITHPVLLALTGPYLGDLPALPNAAALPHPYKSTYETEIIPAIRQRLKELAHDRTPADIPL